MIIHDFDENKFDDYVKKGVVLVDFFATWCGPCKMLTPELEGLAKDKKDIKILKIDIDKYPVVAQKHSIMSVPTLLLYKDGKIVGNTSGYMPKDILKDWINESVK